MVGTRGWWVGMAQRATVLPQNWPCATCPRATTFYSPHNPVMVSPPSVCGEGEGLGVSWTTKHPWMLSPLSARILGMFTSQQWKHLSNDFLKTQQEKRHSWFKTSGTIKKFRAGLSIFSPIPK